MNGLFDFFIKTLFLPLSLLARDMDYSVLIKLTVSINEDGGAHIDGLLICNGNTANFVMNL